MAAIRESLMWLWEQIDGGVRSSSWQHAWETWQDDIHHRPGVWKRLIKHARDSAARAEWFHEGWQQCRGCVLKRLVKAGGVVRAWTDSFQVKGFACGPCQRVVCSLQAWSVHAFKVHGQVQEARLLVSGEQCPICLKHYASNVHLCNHVANSCYCRHRLQAEGYTCEPQPGRGSRQAREAADYLGVAKQGFGPQLPPVSTVTESKEYVFTDTPIWRALMGLLGTCAQCSTQSALDKYRHALCAACMTPAQLARLASAWEAHVTSAAVEWLSVREATLHSEVAQWVCAHLSAAWLVPSHTQPQEHNVTFRQSVAGLAALELDAVAVAQPVIPREYATFAVCHGSHTPFLLSAQGSQDAHLSIQDCCLDYRWCDRIWDFLDSVKAGLVVFCLASVQARDICPQRPIKASSFRKHHRIHTVLQDVVLLVVELWLRAEPCVALLPCPDEALRATLKGLQGLSWVQGSELLLVHNVPEAAVPKKLFHLCN